MTVQGGMRILDADAHVIEPGDLFRAFVPEGVSVMDLPPTTPRIPVGDVDKLADFLADGCSARAYLACMDLQGIDAVVLYPSIGLFVPFLPELHPTRSAAACRVYNDWIADYCSTDPARLHGIALVPTVDPDRAARESEHAAALGVPGVMVRPNRLYDADLGEPAFDGLYETLVHLDLTLSVHEGLGVRGPTIGRDRGGGSFALRHAMSHPMEQMAAMGSLMLGGALDRHPRLRVAFLESGTGWLAWWLARLDEHAEWLAGSETSGLARRPSAMFVDQCVICTDPEDPLVGEAVRAVGAEHVMWASDFPHPDAHYPDAVTGFLADGPAHGLTAPDLRRILWDTPETFYGLATARNPSGD